MERRQTETNLQRKKAATGATNSDAAVTADDAADVVSPRDEDDVPQETLDVFEKVSWPPTADELENFKTIDLTKLPKAYKRDPSARVFVNRSLRLDKIKWFGFDMDYTLAEYLHPQYDDMIYELAKQRLIDVGYPKSVQNLKYEHGFAIRCLVSVKRCLHAFVFVFVFVFVFNYHFFCCDLLTFCLFLF